MKNLSKALAFALLLIPVAAQARPWCSGENELVWIYASGQTPYTYACNDVGTPAITQAAAYAQTKCQQSWDNFASSYTDDGFFPVIYTAPVPGQTGMCRFKYKCRACVIGHLPYILHQHPAHLTPAAAGEVAGGVAGGEVLSVGLHRNGDGEPYYLVDVLTDKEQVQVEVDGTTGRAQIVKQEDGAGVCR